VAEQGPAGQRVGFDAEVEGVEVDPGRTEVEGGAADGVGDGLVFAVGVDDQDVDALIPRGHPDSRVSATIGLRDAGPVGSSG
jgi:hypothetical protein